MGTRRRTLAQVLVCSGCCCGRTDKGKPPVPVDWLKAEWKRLGLLRSVHLTISGCLGPCDLCNVVCVAAAREWTWLGGLSTREQYAALVAWASASAAAGVLLPLPEALQPHRFERFLADDPPQPAHATLAERRGQNGDRER